MSLSESTTNVSLIASAGMTIYRFAKAHTVDGQAIVAADATSVQFITAETVNALDPVPLVVGNGAIALIELGGTLSSGDDVEPGAAGVAVASAGAGDMIAGQILQDGVIGDVVPMTFNPIRRHAA
jgi:hypothetical protein